MSVTKTISVLPLLAMLTGCALSPQIPIEGSTSADAQLSRDVYGKVVAHTETKGCDDLDRIKTKIVEYPHGEPGERRAEERWEAFGCNATYPYQITFRDDGRGGTYYSIAPVMND